MLLEKPTLKPVEGFDPIVGAATSDRFWPEDGASPVAPLARPPEGIAHHYCKLALVRLTNETWEVVEDCRNLFPPLTDLQGLQAEPGVHVVHIRSGSHDPLRNDTDLLVQRGFQPDRPAQKIKGNIHYEEYW